MTDLRTAAPPQRPAEPVHRSRKMGQDDTPAKVRLSEGLGPNAEDDEREDIIRMAREAGLFEVPYPNPSNMKEIERFAALVTARAQLELQNQCGETCERAKLCVACAKELSDE